LLSLQNATSGYFAYQPGYSAANSYDASAYAVIALLGKYLPVGTISAPSSTSTSPLVVTITPSSLPDATVGAAYDETITAADANASDTFAWTIATSTLPSSLTITTSSTSTTTAAGISISGTPTAAGTYNLSVAVASNASSTSSSTKNYTLTVDAAAATQSSGGSGGGGGAAPTSYQVSYRITGPSGDLCNGNGLAITAIDVLTDASSFCGITYHVQSYSAISYVDRIGAFSAAGVNGWLYLVDGVKPSIGAGDYKVKTNDSVVWYFGNGTAAAPSSTTTTTSSGGTTNTSTIATTTTALATTTVATTSTIAIATSTVFGASTTATTSGINNAGENISALEQELTTLEFQVHSCSFQFNKNLRRGISNTDVKNLQTVLGYLPIAEGAALSTTGYFGSATEAAVTAFQNMWSDKILTPNGMSSGNGFVGAATRTVLNGLCSQQSGGAK
jgi:hypothetical protein